MASSKTGKMQHRLRVPLCSLEKAQQGVISDEEGRFVLPELRYDTLLGDTLIIQYLGYDALRIPGSALQTDRLLVVELGIQPVDLAEVEVTAQRQIVDVSSAAPGSIPPWCPTTWNGSRLHLTRL